MRGRGATFRGWCSEYLEGRLKLDELITRRIKLEEINNGFAALARGEGIRTVVMFD